MTQGTVLLVLEPSTYRAALELAIRQLGCHVITTEDESLAVQQAIVDLPHAVVSSVSHRDFLGRLEASLVSISQNNQPYVLALPASQTPAQGDADQESYDSNDTQGVHAIARAVVDLIRSDEHSRARSQQLIQRDGLLLDRARYEATLEGNALDLTLTEFNILWTLAHAPERARTRQELVEASRGVGAQVQTRTIDAHIKSLRRKLGDAAWLIETVRGIGYRYAATSAEFSAMVVNRSRDVIDAYTEGN